MLVDGEKSYLLQGNSAELEKFAAQRAKVTGMLDGTTIRVGAVELE